MSKMRELEAGKKERKERKKERKEEREKCFSISTFLLISVHKVRWERLKKVVGFWLAVRELIRFVFVPVVSKKLDTFSEIFLLCFPKERAE